MPQDSPAQCPRKMGHVCSHRREAAPGLEACDVNKGASESHWRVFGVGHLGGMEDVFRRLPCRLA